MGASCGAGGVTSLVAQQPRIVEPWVTCLELHILGVVTQGCNLVPLQVGEEGSVSQQQGQALCYLVSLMLKPWQTKTKSEILPKKKEKKKKQIKEKRKRHLIIQNFHRMYVLGVPQSLIPLQVLFTGKLFIENYLDKEILQTVLLG